MKKFFALAFILLLSSSALWAQDLSIDDVVSRAARGVEEKLPHGAKVAVLNFNSPSVKFSEYAMEELSGELVQGGKITVVDRHNIEAIMKEMEFQMSGHVSDESIQKIGQMLGAQAVASGSLTDMGTNYRFRVKVINIETAALQSQMSFNLKKDAQVAFLMGGAEAVQEIGKEREAIKREEKRAAEQARREQDECDFTKGQRTSAWLLNLAVPGLGSHTVMQDKKGATTSLLIGGGGLVAFLIGGVAMDGTSSGTRDLLIIGGLMTWTVGNGIYSIVRSSTYHKPGAAECLGEKSASAPLRNLNVAVFPDQNGNLKTYASYSMEF